MLHGEKKFKQSKEFASKHNARGIKLEDFYCMTESSKSENEIIFDAVIKSYDIGFLDGYRKALSEKRGGKL